MAKLLLAMTYATLNDLLCLPVNLNHIQVRLKIVLKHKLFKISKANYCVHRCKIS